MNYSSPPDWATHEGRFCGIVPIWFADESGGGCMMVGKNWFADAILLPAITFTFQIAAAIFGWEEFPIEIWEIRQ